MAGHSKFKNIQHRKGAQDQKRAKIFTRLTRDIITAARSGGVDPKNNARLRLALTNARSQNLPKERIDKALARANDQTYNDNYQDTRYEAYAPGGVALIIETMTDNKNRTVSEIRSKLNKFGGNLAENGAVSFMFDRLGVIKYNKSVVSVDQLLEDVIDFDLYNIETQEDENILYVNISSFGQCVDLLCEKYGNPSYSDIEWKAKELIPITDHERASKLIKLINEIDESDDVQEIFGNYKIEASIN